VFDTALLPKFRSGNMTITSMAQINYDSEGIAQDP